MSQLNETLELMQTRRSVRDFKPDMVPEDILDKIIEAGLWAASGRNRQSPIIIKENTDILKITHEKIANHLGTAREVVTRMLRYFQSENLVRLSRGTIEITDKKGLEELSE